MDEAELAAERAATVEADWRWYENYAITYRNELERLGDVAKDQVDGLVAEWQRTHLARMQECHRSMNDGGSRCPD